MSSCVDSEQYSIFPVGDSTCNRPVISTRIRSDQFFLLLKSVPPFTTGAFSEADDDCVGLDELDSPLSIALLSKTVVAAAAADEDEVGPGKAVLLLLK